MQLFATSINTQLVAIERAPPTSCYFRFSKLKGRITKASPKYYEIVMMAQKRILCFFCPPLPM